MKRLQGKPFALLGVNSDRDRENLKKVIKKKNLTWRSFWDGGSTSGPIARKWNVVGWPTYYILDHRGVIRAKDLRGELLDRVVDQLVKQVGAKGIRPRSCEREQRASRLVDQGACKEQMSAFYATPQR